MKFLTAGLTITLIFLLTVTQIAADEVALRIVGGEPEDYKDSDGNVWYTYNNPYDEKGWGGYLGGSPPATTFPQNNAVAENETEYDDFLFRNCTHNLNERTYRLNLDDGTYTINFLFCEHWVGKRGFSIKVGETIALENYVLSGPDHKAIVESISDMKVTEGSLDITWYSAPETGAADQNPIFNAIEVVLVTASVKPERKLSLTWGEIKAR